jgi:hypothetical protein
MSTLQNHRHQVLKIKSEIWVFELMVVANAQHFGTVLNERGEASSKWNYIV